MIIFDRMLSDTICLFTSISKEYRPRRGQRGLLMKMNLARESSGKRETPSIVTNHQKTVPGAPVLELSSYYGALMT